MYGNHDRALCKRRKHDGEDMTVFPVLLRSLCLQPVCVGNLRDENPDSPDIAAKGDVHGQGTSRWSCSPSTASLE